MTKIQAQKRDGAVKVADIRLSGLVPGIVYGPGREPEAVSVSKVEFEKAFKESGESTTVSMTIDGKPIDVLIHDVQFDPVKNIPTHIDFYAVDMNRPIEVSVPIEYTGVAGAVKSGVGTLVKVLHEIEVKALPKDLPHQIVIDIGGLDTLESQISAGEVSLPAGVTLITKPGEIVASIAPLAKDEPTEAPVMDLSSIEVEKKGKKEEAEPAE